MKSFFKFLFSFIIVAAIGMAGVGWVYLSRELPKPGPLAAEKLVYIQPGSSVGKITQKLLEEGVIANEWYFRFGAWRQQSKGMMKAGEYLFPGQVSIPDAITILQEGHVHQRQVTIPEGLTSHEIVALLNKAEFADDPLQTVPAEGTLLPETYNYTYDDKRSAIIDRMARGMEDALKKYWPKRSADLPLKTPGEVVTLASIVEKETALTSERARIAGVFVNRLKRGMPLQSDPTTIYALTKGKGRLGRPLTRADLETKSPYNTYQVAGLPPGPIANPGVESLIAVLAPEQNDYLYFVANGEGGHAFARNYDEHNANVAKWRQIQRSRQ